jgi:puromycin-sensitive aminopeptidase
MTGTADTDDNPSYRLPRTLVPLAYRLELTPDLEAARFSGEVEIDLTVRAPTTTVVLNAAELEIGRAELLPSGGATPLSPVSVTLDPDEERAALTFATPLDPGEATLRLGFEGILNDKLHGFYRSTFTDDARTEHVIATT